MKPKSVLLILLAMATAGSIGWFAARRANDQPGATAATAASGRKVLHYQSAMHPWIKSDQPGKCTICGMDLTPVFEGDPGFETGPGLVTLSSNTLNVIHVQTEPVRRRILRRTLRVAGTIDDDETRHRIISAYVDGRVDRLFITHVGAEVIEGQPLATIYSPMLLAAEREYVTLRSRRPDSPSLQVEHARLLEGAAQRLRRLGLAEAQIEALPRKPDASQQTDLLAPLSGTVVARFVYEGQYVKEGDRLFEISDFSTMWFRFDAYEQDLPWLKPGQAVEVRTPAIPGRVFPASVSFIDPNLNDPTRSAKVRVEMANPMVEQDGRKRRELYHRLYAEGQVQVEAAEVIALPRSAVLSPDGRPFVFVARGGGAFERREVNLGRRGDEFWEVLGGIVEGDPVVTTGNLLIDAQAQLNQAATPSAPPPAAGSASSSRELSPAQGDVVSELLTLADRAGSALAADNLEGFNGVAAALHTLIPKLADAFDSAPAWQPAVQDLVTRGHLEKAADLTTARGEFLKFSLAVADLAAALRPQLRFKSWRIFQCPMVDSAIPGAPKTGRWIQREAAIRNPFFGSRMIDCGAEVE